MSDLSCDVVVAGGGPAGAAAAIALARLGRSVVVVDRGRPGSTRPGESLAPAGNRLLTELGLDAASILEGQRPSLALASSWGRDGIRSTDLSMHPYGPAWQIDRDRFDTRLLDAAAARGVQVLRRTSLRRVERVDSTSWRVALGDGTVVRTAWIVDATGRAAAIATRLGAIRRRFSRLTALAASVEPSCTSVAETLVETCAAGWWYSARMPDGHLAIALFCDPAALPARAIDRRGLWLTSLAATSHTSRRVARFDRPPRLGAAVADSANIAPVSAAGWTAVGDAACAMDPLSSFGLCVAIGAGIQAAAAIDGSLRGHDRALHDYRAFVDRRFHEDERVRLSFYAMETRYACAPFWAGRHRACAS